MITTVYKIRSILKLFKINVLCWQLFNLNTPLMFWKVIPTSLKFVFVTSMNLIEIELISYSLYQIPAITISEHCFAFKRTFSLIYLLKVCLLFLRKEIVHGIIYYFIFTTDWHLSFLSCFPPPHYWMFPKEM